jgi:hypothetical protein
MKTNATLVTEARQAAEQQRAWYKASRTLGAEVRVPSGKIVAELLDALADEIEILQRRIKS